MAEIRWSAVMGKAEEDALFTAMLARAAPRRVLDAGCGRGRFLAAAGRALPGADIVGLDHQRRVVVDARAACETLPLAGRPAFAVGHVQALPFPDATFDAVTSMEVLECVADPAAAIAELLRVLRPGGLLLLEHSDWDTLHFDIPDRALERTVVRAWIETPHPLMQHADPALGRRLPALARAAGLADLECGAFAIVEVDSVPGGHGRVVGEGAGELAVRTGAIGEAGRRRWLALLDEAQAAGRSLFGVTHYWCLGRRPADAETTPRAAPRAPRA